MNKQNDTPQYEDREKVDTNKIKIHLHRNRQFKLLIAIVVLALILTSVLFISIKKDKLYGSWILANITYTFDGRGKGKMDITTDQYRYTYEIKKNQLLIDFKDEKLHDCTYTFTVDDDTLTLVGGKGTVGGNYDLHRQPK